MVDQNRHYYENNYDAIELAHRARGNKNMYSKRML